jgi:Mg2+/citrate symporter
MFLLKNKKNNKIFFLNLIVQIGIQNDFPQIIFFITSTCIDLLVNSSNVK